MICSKNSRRCSPTSNTHQFDLNCKLYRENPRKFPLFLPISPFLPVVLAHLSECLNGAYDKLQGSNSWEGQVFDDIEFIYTSQLFLGTPN